MDSFEVVSDGLTLQKSRVVNLSFLLRSYQGNSEEVGCYVAGHPLSKGNCYFEVSDAGIHSDMMKERLVLWEIIQNMIGFPHTVVSLESQWSELHTKMCVPPNSLRSTVQSHHLKTVQAALD